MSWVYLVLAILFEVCGTTLMKISQGFTNIKYAMAMLICYMLSLSMLTLALKKIRTRNCLCNLVRCGNSVSSSYRISVF